MTRDIGLDGAPCGISVGEPAGGGPPWGTREGLLMPCVIFSLPEPILLGCEHQRDKVGRLEVDFRGCGCKYAAVATEVSIFES